MRNVVAMTEAVMTAEAVMAAVTEPEMQMLRLGIPSTNCGQNTQGENCNTAQKAISLVRTIHRKPHVFGFNPANP